MFYYSLGAFHDGVGDAKDCDSDDLFIMSDSVLRPDPDRPYSRNPWIFSNCSVESFKKTLKDKECVMSLGDVFNKTEWKTFTKIEPGERYSPDEQCRHIHGFRSSYCGISAITDRYWTYNRKSIQPITDVIGNRTSWVLTFAVAETHQ
ncbi:hypothetical protein CHS0354_021086 [Potamilus streckersoni]|uniref:Uncharacterized protein n=1 Tax=Potamilus streckersoni TaxID=2493646 RepID=A0AAE0SDM5_9BIVA|nr:hypothetical protein CHS0354_021086 [Potamilus streckersoni]